MNDRLLAETTQRAAALAESGLPDCHNRPLPVDAAGSKLDPLLYLRQLNEHRSACPTCRARAAFLEDRFGPTREPLVLQGALAVDALYRRPIVGPLLLTGMGAGSLALLGSLSAAWLPTSFGPPLAWTLSMLATMAMTAGLYYAVPAAHRRSFPKRFLARVVSATAGVLFFDLLVRFWDHSSPLRYLLTIDGPAAPIIKALIIGVGLAVVWPLLAKRASGA